MKDMILFPEDIDRLNLVLSQLVQKANLLLAVLINKDGRMLTSQGSLGQVDTVSMAALIAGNSASTLAIAQLMGETEFSTMYHQGKDKHIYIATVDENTFLSLVFDDRTNIDRVKVFARQFDRQLKSGLFQVYNKTEDQINLDLDMMGEYEQNIQQAAPYMPSPPMNQRPQETFDSRKDSLHTNVNQYPPQEKLNPNITEEIVFDIDSTKAGASSQNPNDTNYIYLHNKIRETNKRKKDE
jgi:predicted regulator of Ras-like GTPase activity (Roadblock/LC7/MglB family)